MQKAKDFASKHWPTGLVVAILISMTAYLSQDKLVALSKADAECSSAIKINGKMINEVEKRVTAIETKMPYTTEALKKNTQTIENMAKDVQEIKLILVKSIRERGGGQGDE